MYRIFKLTVMLYVSLASAELYVALATVFRRFEFELYGTSRDVDAKHDFFVLSPRLDSKGMRVLVMG